MLLLSRRIDGRMRIRLGIWAFCLNQDRCEVAFWKNVIHSRSSEPKNPNCQREQTLFPNKLPRTRESRVPTFTRRRANITPKSMFKKHSPIISEFQCEAWMKFSTDMLGESAKRRNRSRERRIHYSTWFVSQSASESISQRSGFIDHPGYPGSSHCT